MYGERREEGKAQAKGLCFLATRDTKIVGKADAGYASHIHWRCVSGDVSTALKMLERMVSFPLLNSARLE